MSYKSVKNKLEAQVSTEKADISICSTRRPRLLSFVQEHISITVRLR